MANFQQYLQRVKSEIREVTVADLQKARPPQLSPVLIDVREGEEYNEGYIPGATWIPRGKLELRIEDVVPDRAAELVLYCAGGNRSALAGYLSGGNPPYPRLNMSARAAWSDDLSMTRGRHNIKMGVALEFNHKTGERRRRACRPPAAAVPFCEPYTRWAPSGICQHSREPRSRTDESQRQCLRSRSANKQYVLGEQQPRGVL